jgi:hypothetical protein
MPDISNRSKILENGNADEIENCVFKVAIHFSKANGKLKLR